MDTHTDRQRLSPNVVNTRVIVMPPTLWSRGWSTVSRRTHADFDAHLDDDEAYHCRGERICSGKPEQHSAASHGCGNRGDGIGTMVLRAGDEDCRPALLAGGSGDPIQCFLAGDCNEGNDKRPRAHRLLCPHE